MKLYKKIIIGVLLLGVIAVAGVEGYKYYLRKTDVGVPEWSQALYLKNDVDCKVYWLGDLPKLPEQFEYQQLAGIEEKTIDFDHDYIFVIVNDTDSAKKIMASDVIALIDIANKNSNFNFIYLGERQLKMISDTIPDCNFDDDDLSFGYVMLEGERIHEYGIYSKKDREYEQMNDMLLAEQVIFSIERDVKAADSSKH
ncbi:MAG: hypothetical protein K5927_08770 [Lachnospiraceae bacterium]|nr:hypothetical protein [Lachnospiraceae bacterium]